MYQILICLFLAKKRTKLTTLFRLGASATRKGKVRHATSKDFSEITYFSGAQFSNPDRCAQNINCINQLLIPIGVQAHRRNKKTCI
mmetsp:Transcript_22732/g.67196  ORF Transcript_22732/g.67196 Transcript_22732/m.67196 type:complete len:86 (-) Transcript_22732:87-344(-)